MKKKLKKSSLVVSSCAIRLVFYGLFLLGPYILTESHAQYRRMRIETDGIEEIERKEYL